MGHWSYLAVLAFIVLGTLWLEIVLRTHAFLRLRRLVLSVVPVVAVFVIWDVYAIAHKHWTFEASRVTGVNLPGHLPLEEVLFFVVIPLASILTFEAVRSARGWPAGDEEPPPDLGSTAP